MVLPEKISIARCPYFDRCNGCQYQDLPYDEQLQIKGERVRQCFGEWVEDLPPISKTIPSPLVYGYRTKLTPHYGRIRGKGDEPIGFRGKESGRIVDIETCPLATEAINDHLPICRSKIRSTPTKRGGTLLLRQGLGGVTTNHRDIISEIVGPLTFHFLAGDFFQNNHSILPIFADYVLGQAIDPAINFAVDTYCGIGFFSLLAAFHFQSVVGIEICPTAVRMARLNALANGIGNAQFFTGDAAAIFSAIHFPSSEVSLILDPPRSGCTPSFMDQLLRFAPRRVVYVSCAPETQIRDIKRILSHYRVIAIQPIDLFPQTQHVENVVTLVLQTADNS